MTPRQIVRALDEYIIGQDDAKRAVAIALRNRWRRQRLPEELREEILPNNILMIGPTGVGKTEIARRLAGIAGAPFVKIEASKFTEVGYVGRDVESMIRDLVEVAVSQVRSEQTEQIEQAAKHRVEEKILDLLLPPITPEPEKPKGVFSELVQVLGESDPSISEAAANLPRKPDKTISAEEEQSRQRTRNKLLKKLRDGELDKREVEIRTADRATGLMQVFGPMGMEEMGINIQEMLGPMMPAKRKKRRVSIGEAKNLLLGEEVEKLLDMDAVIREAIHRTEEMGILFIDEIDKVSRDDEGGSGPDVSREGVQRDILPVVEGTRVTTKYGPVRTDHILFIAAGAFHVAKPSDLIPELQGRFPIRVELDPLTKRDFIRILTEPRNALVTQYTALLGAENVELVFDKNAVKLIAEIAEELNETQENIGARRLHTVMTKLLEEEMFKLPHRSITKVSITRKLVLERLEDLLEDEDVGRYIL